MKSIGFGVVAVVCVSLIATCGGAGGTGGGLQTTVSCTGAADTGRCLEYTNLPPQGAEQFQRTCGGTVGAACSREGVTGVCTKLALDGISMSTVYYSTVYDSQASAIQQECTAGGGTWSAS